MHNTRRSDHRRVVRVFSGTSMEIVEQRQQPHFREEQSELMYKLLQKNNPG